MKISRVLPVAGILTLLVCGGSVLAQMPPIPPGAGVGVHRQPAGSRFHSHPMKHTHHRSATSHHKRAPRAQ
jgi:hypothetical protein